MTDIVREGRRVLVFSAHAADFCSRAGGTIIRLAEAGGQVHVCDMTYGEQCESPVLWKSHPDLTLEEVKKIRDREIQAAAAVLGATAECFDFGDSPLVVGPERLRLLLDKIRSFRPDLVLTHWRDDFLHPDHAETTRAAIWASRYCFRPGIKTDDPPCPAPEIVCYETTAGTAPVARYVPNLYVDITREFPRKKESLACFAAQSGLCETYEILARYRGLEARSSAWMPDCQMAEGFFRIGVEAMG